MQEVSFRYDPGSPWVLQNITMAVQPGQKVGLVGRTGSSKSTLVKLLIGLYPPTQGEIYFDGVLLSRLNYRSVRRQMGVVLQKAFLFSGSIRENIAFNEPSLPLSAVQHAARLALIHGDIVQMPMGYEPVWRKGAPAYPADNANALPWRGHAPRPRRFCYSMKRPVIWMPSPSTTLNKTSAVCAQPVWSSPIG